MGAIKRQFCHMVTHVFDNSNLSQEIFAIDTWEAVICFLRHGRKHMLTILPTIWRPGLIGVIKRQFFHMLTHVSDNSNLLHEIFAIDTWGAVICSLGHGRNAYDLSDCIETRLTLYFLIPHAGSSTQ